MKYEVELRSSHLLLSPTLSNLMMKESNRVYVAYKEENKTLLVTPKENSWFPKLHQSQEFMLKSKDLKGTKSISIREILIDHDLDDLDRKLSCTVHDGKKFMKIDFANPA